MKVLIVGAGISGLILANSIQKYEKNIEIAVFERDLSPCSRCQGVYISLNNVGLKYLYHSLSEEKCNKIKNILKPYLFTLTNRKMERLYGLTISKSINRTKLREILMEGIDIQYNKNFQSFEETKENVTAFFEDGSSITGDFLVGADGVNSNVRKMKVPNFKFSDMKVLKIRGWITNVPESSFILGEVATKIIGIHRNSILIVKKTNIKEDGSESYDMFFNYEFIPKSLNIPEGKVEMMKFLKEEMKSFNPLVADIINKFALPEHIINEKPSFLTQASPFHTFDTSRVTLLGDASHCMVSHGGLGANMAIVDGNKLAMTLIDIYTKNIDFYESLKSFNKEMIKRGFKAINISKKYTELMFRKPTGPFGEKIRNNYLEWYCRLINWGVIVIPQ